MEPSRVRRPKTAWKHGATPSAAIDRVSPAEQGFRSLDLSGKTRLQRASSIRFCLDVSEEDLFVVRRSRRWPGTRQTCPRSRAHAIGTSTNSRGNVWLRSRLPLIYRACYNLSGRVRQEPRTPRRRDAALHGPGDPLEHRNERERSDRELPQAGRCGASVLAGHAAFGSQMEKSVDVFLDPFV